MHDQIEQEVILKWWPQGLRRVLPVYCVRITYIKYKHNKIYIHINIYVSKPSHVWPTGRPAAAGNRQTNGRRASAVREDVTSGGSYAWCVSACVCGTVEWGWGSRWTIIGRGFRISGNQVSRRPQYNIGTYLIVLYLYTYMPTHTHTHAHTHTHTIHATCL